MKNEDEPTTQCWPREGEGLPREAIERLDRAAHRILRRRGYGYVRTITDDESPDRDDTALLVH